LPDVVNATKGLMADVRHRQRVGCFP